MDVSASVRHCAANAVNDATVRLYLGLYSKRDGHFSISALLRALPRILMSTSRDAR